MLDPFQQIVEEAIQINSLTPVDFAKIWRFTGAATYKIARIQLHKVFDQCTQAGFTSSYDLDKSKPRKIYLSFNLLALYLYSCRTPVAIESERTLRKLVHYLEPAETLKETTAAKPAVLSAPAPAASAQKRAKQKETSEIPVKPKSEQDLRKIIKSWLARSDVFAIDFEELWPLAGYKDRDIAKYDFKAFVSVSVNGRRFCWWSPPGHPDAVYITSEAAKAFLVYNATPESTALLKVWDEVETAQGKTSETLPEQEDPVVPALNYALGKHEGLLQQLATPETEKPEETKPTDTQDATEGLVPAEIPDGDLVAVIKTWIQAPPDSTPIEFEKVWNLDGSTRKDNAKARFLQVKEHLLKYGLAKENEFTEILGKVDIGSGTKRQITTWKMSLNVFKHYISSSQKERGYRTRGKLHQAEEELEQLKTAIRKTGGYNVNPIIQLADILDNPALNSQLMLELTHRVQKLKQENQIQAQDIEVKAEKITQLEGRVEKLLPAEKALELLADDPRAKTLKETAGRLRIRLKDLTRFMCQNNWIYKTNYARNSGEPWLGFRQKFESGLLIQSNYDRPTEYGTYSHYGVKVTQKGLIKLAKLLSIDLTKLSEGDNNSDE